VGPSSFKHLQADAAWFGSPGPGEIRIASGKGAMPMPGEFCGRCAPPAPRRPGVIRRQFHRGIGTRLNVKAVVVVRERRAFIRGRGRRCRGQAPLKDQARPIPTPKPKPPPNKRRAKSSNRAINSEAHGGPPARGPSARNPCESGPWGWKRRRLARSTTTRIAVVDQVSSTSTAVNREHAVRPNSCPASNSARGPAEGERPHHQQWMRKLRLVRKTNGPAPGRRSAGSGAGHRPPPGYPSAGPRPVDGSRWRKGAGLAGKVLSWGLFPPASHPNRRFLCHANIWSLSRTAEAAGPGGQHRLQAGLRR